MPTYDASLPQVNKQFEDLYVCRTQVLGNSVSIQGNYTCLGWDKYGCIVVDEKCFAQRK